MTLTWRHLRRHLNPSRWPLAARVPMLVVGLMLSVSAVVTDRVLARLAETQNRHLTQLSDAYLDGLSSALIPHVLREDVWEVYDVLDRAAQRYKGLDIAWTTVTDLNQRVVASSHPRQFPLQATMPVAARDPDPKNNTKIDEANGIALLSRDLVYQGRTLGAVNAQVRIGALIRERREVLVTLIVTNAALTLLLAVIGYVAVLRMLRPVRILSDHMRPGTEGSAIPIPQSALTRPQSEFGELFRRYNSLLLGVTERERLLKHLAEEERLAALGRLAAGMAHEINNPLGGMLNAVTSLRQHGERLDVRETSMRLIERGLIGIRDIVRSSLATYRHHKDERALVAADFDDLALLLQPEVKRKNLRLDWCNRIERDVDVPAGAVRDATLNLLLNACAATGPYGPIWFEATLTDGAVRVEVRDSGSGISKANVDYLNAPGDPSTPLEEQGGLGLWMVKRLVHQTRGTVKAATIPGGGTTVVLTIPERREKLEGLRHVA